MQMFCFYRGSDHTLFHSQFTFVIRQTIEQQVESDDQYTLHTKKKSKKNLLSFRGEVLLLFLVFFCCLVGNCNHFSIEKDLLCSRAIFSTKSLFIIPENILIQNIYIFKAVICEYTVLCAWYQMKLFVFIILCWEAVQLNTFWESYAHSEIWRNLCRELDIRKKKRRIK